MFYCAARAINIVKMPLQIFDIVAYVWYIIFSTLAL